MSIPLSLIHRLNTYKKDPKYEDWSNSQDDSQLPLRFGMLHSAHDMKYVPLPLPFQSLLRSRIKQDKYVEKEDLDPSPHNGDTHT